MLSQGYNPPPRRGNHIDPRFHGKWLRVAAGKAHDRAGESRRLFEPIAAIKGEILINPDSPDG